MAAATGFWNHQMQTGQMTAGNALGGTIGSMPASASATADASATSSPSDSSSDSATISGNDFLTLLVTEMQNQDPTADTDPNEYINQLVQVNSLEQLIDINQNLTTAIGGAGSSSPGSTTGQTAGSPGVTGLTAANATAQLQGAARNKAAGAPPASQPVVPSAGALNAGSVHPARVRHAPGNLDVPTAKAAADHVAHALDGRSHKSSIPAGLSGVQ
jgi:flagellar basal-body rod modification protein FlgD